MILTPCTPVALHACGGAGADRAAPRRHSDPHPGRHRRLHALLRPPRQLRAEPYAKPLALCSLLLHKRSALSLFHQRSALSLFWGSSSPAQASPTRSFTSHCQTLPNVFLCTLCFALFRTGTSIIFISHVVWEDLFWNQARLARECERKGLIGR